MNFRLSLAGLVFLLAMAPASALAVNSVLSGLFDGSEPKINSLPGTCSRAANEQLGYQQYGNVQVAATGEYTVADAFNFIGVDISANIYRNSFDPGNPQANLVTPNGIDEVEDVDLEAGASYVLVVQIYCTNEPGEWVNREGAWTLTFSGPGAVTSTTNVTVPEWTEGAFSQADPTVNTVCGNSQYQQSGPIRVSTAGIYYYEDISLNFAVDTCLQIFTAPFDPSNPAANRIFDADDFGQVAMQPGVDYYFVTQPLNEPDEGEFFYIFAPPAPFSITYAISGSWYDPQTDGQGFLIDVFDTNNVMFLAWFTYDLERPPGDVTAMIGDPGHRWMTGAGPFQGDTANLTITWSSGMIFDSPTPPVERENDGTMTVEFDDCKAGRVIYDLGQSGRTGTVPIQRIANDAVPLCENLTVRPGQPGPL